VADSSRNTAIHYAAAYGWFHCVQVLLQASANPDVYNDKKVTYMYFVDSFVERIDPRGLWIPVFAGTGA